MLTINAQIRKISGKKVKSLRKTGVLPAVLYGPEIKNLNLEVSLKEFEKIYKEVGETSLISLQADKKKFPVLIHEIKKHPLTSQPIHVDFYQPKLKEEVTAKIPLVLEGEAPAVKELGGTLVRNIAEIEIKALPTDLPKELKADVKSLKTFEDNISVKDIILPKGVRILRSQEDIIAFIAQPEKIEEELEKPVEEKVEEVEKIEKKKEEEVVEEEERKEEPKTEKKTEKKAEKKEK